MKQQNKPQQQPNPNPNKWQQPVQKPGEKKPHPQHPERKDRSGCC